jgi:hypothetical protein
VRTHLNALTAYGAGKLGPAASTSLGQPAVVHRSCCGMLRRYPGYAIAQPPRQQQQQQTDLQ